MKIPLIIITLLFLVGCTATSPDTSPDTSPPTNIIISINSGGDWTSSTSVTLTLSAVDASEMYVTNTSGCGSGGSWEAYSTSKAWTLGQSNDTATVYVKYRDTALNESSCASDTITHDNTAPSGGSISINGGATTTISTLVTLTLAASGASQMYVTNTLGCGSGSSWETYSTSKSWTLGQTNTTATVYIKYGDAAGNESACISDTITHDTTAPTNGSISINSGATYTTTTPVTLTLNITGATQMYVTNTTACTSNGTWEAYNTSKAWTLSQTNTTVLVYVKFRNELLNESSCYSDSIIHDNTAPSGTIIINNNDAYTNLLLVTLSLSSESASQMYVTNTSGCGSGGSWEAYSTSKAWTLINTNATNRVYINFKDAADNLSGCTNDLIIHDNIAPSNGTISINSGGLTTTSADVTLTLAATAASQMYITNSAGCTTNGVWESYNTSKSWRTELIGSPTAYVKYRDTALNESSCISDSIINDGVGVWSTTSLSNAPTARQKPSAVWTGAKMIVWGGTLGTGGLYDPENNSWSSMSTLDAADGVIDNTPIWTGSKMLVWGGRGGVTEYNTMGIYDPQTDTWVKTTGENAPQARFEHSAVWTGSKMIVWGGRYSIGGGSYAFLNSGGIYDPITNTWATTSLSNAPTARMWHSAVWTGSKMIVWGGFGDGGYRNDGAAYDPILNTWTTISSPSFSIGKAEGSTIWTGSKMIVWGGSSLNTGGQYDPITDSWSATTTTGAPTDRLNHTAVWTGSKMIVWGGITGSTSHDSGGIYDPDLNQWQRTTTTDVPYERYRFSAVWTGSKMIVWGGSSNNGTLTLNSGGIYTP